MRAALPYLVAPALLLLPAYAHASPFGIQTVVAEPAPTEGGAPADADGSTEAPSMDPTAEPAPAEPDPVAEPADPTAEGPAEEAGAGDPTMDEESADPTLDEAEEEGLSGGDPGASNVHGIGVRSGITVVPTWILSGFLASHSNALCRQEVGDFGADRGLTKTQGCNFYVGGEYIYRKSPIFDIVAAVGYQQMKTPDGLWLDEDECSGGTCDLSAADYTEINLSFVFLEADFIARAPVLKTPDIEIGIGGGGGIGLGIIVGDGVFQTPLGPQAQADGSCLSIDDFSDFTKCTPAWFDDDEIDQNGDGNVTDPPPFPDPYGNNPPIDNYPYANCSADECSETDLNSFGSRIKNNDVPPVIPVVNLILSARFIIKDTFGIDIRGGFNTGFYFGGSLDYFFGAGKKKKKK